MNIAAEGDLMVSPLDGCFFCHPEAWRIVLMTKHSQVVVGAGPLCPGYVLVAPQHHIHSVAELPPELLGDFLATCTLVTAALSHQYGRGYTSYEHGRVGACRMLETAHVWSTFCHHAHRVFIPHDIDCLDAIAERFDAVNRIDVASDISGLSAAEYVFYEHGHEQVSRFVATGNPRIPSQFMRRVLTSRLNLGRDWNWASDLRLPEMIDTVSYLRPEFVGINRGPTSDLPVINLSRTVSFDGLASTGKSTVARMIATAARRPMIETGLFFRATAVRRLRGETGVPPLDPVAGIAATLTELRSEEVTRAAVLAASESETRRRYDQWIDEVARSLAPCVIIGRDSWRAAGADAVRIVLHADFDVRLRRRYLELVDATAIVPDLARLRSDMADADVKDAAKLPPPSTSAPVQNGRRRLIATVRDVLAVIDEH